MVKLQLDFTILTAFTALFNLSQSYFIIIKICFINQRKTDHRLHFKLVLIEYLKFSQVGYYTDQTILLLSVITKAIC